MRNRLKSVLKTFNNEERGVILPLVLIGLLMIVLIIPPLLSMISTSLLAGDVYGNKSQELYAADAGVMYATCLVSGLEPEDIEEMFGEEGTGTYECELPEEINGKTVTIEIVRSGAGYIVTSTATGNNGFATTIETLVQDPPPLPPIWMAAGALDGDLEIKADVGTETEWVSIYANGNIYMTGNSQVYGNAYYTAGHGILAYPPAGEFHGIGMETVELQLDPSYIPDEPVDIHIGDMNITKSGELGPVYIQGNLKISGQAKVELKGTVWVTGKIVMEALSGVRGMDDDGDLYFIVSEYSAIDDAIHVAGNTPEGYDYKVEAMLYAPNGHIFIAGYAGVNGAAIGKSVEVLGASSFCSPLPFVEIVPDYYRMETSYWKIS